MMVEHHRDASVHKVISKFYLYKMSNGTHIKLFQALHIKIIGSQLTGAMLGWNPGVVINSYKHILLIATEQII